MPLCQLALLWFLSAADQTAATNSVAGSELLTRSLEATSDPAHGQILYLKRCASCHGKRAWGDGPREIPALAGQRQGYLVQQMARFLAGDRLGSEMHGAAMRDSLQPPDVDRPQAVADLAAFLAQLAPNVRAEHGDGQALTRGQQLYGANCAACHGGDGAGSDAGTIPRLAGQHFPYLVSRLGSFTVVHRGPPGAKGQLAPGDQQPVADYLSRLGQ